MSNAKRRHRRRRRRGRLVVGKTMFNGGQIVIYQDRITAVFTGLVRGVHIPER